MSGATSATGGVDRRITGLALVLAAVALVVVLAACGINTKRGSEAVDPGSTATTATTVPLITTTTRGADFTLPSIPRGDPNTTQSTRPATTTTVVATTDPGGPPSTNRSPTGTTPGGVNQDNLTVKLVGALDLPQDIAACTSQKMFDTMTSAQLDTFVQHIDSLSVPSDIQLTFTGLLSNCIAGE